MAEDNGISYVASGEKQRLQRAADRAAANAPRDPDNANRPTRKSKLRMSEEDIVGLASILALSLGKDKTRRDLETLVNLFSLTTTNLRSMLSQRAINRGATIEIID